MERPYYTKNTHEIFTQRFVVYELHTGLCGVYNYSFLRLFPRHGSMVTTPTPSHTSPDPIHRPNAHRGEERKEKEGRRRYGPGSERKETINAFSEVSPDRPLSERSLNDV